MAWLTLSWAATSVQAQPVAPVPAEADKHSHAIDLGPHPSEGADAIVVITPDTNYELHRAKKIMRIIKGSMHSNERSVVDITVGAITHAPESIVAPLEKGRPVKLFLRRYPGGNDYYITAVFPADFPSEELK